MITIKQRRGRRESGGGGRRKVREGPPALYGNSYCSGCGALRRLESFQEKTLGYSRQCKMLRNISAAATLLLWIRDNDVVCRPKHKRFRCVEIQGAQKMSSSERNTHRFGSF